MRIGVDLMGSDSSPTLLFEGVQRAQQALGDAVSFRLYATQEVAPTVEEEGIAVEVVPTFISMEENPLAAVRSKKDASVMRMLRDLAEGAIDVAISAGSTGALITASTVLLPRLPTIHRPALLAILPSEKGGIATLDVGGFIEPRVEHLVQFARLGVAYQRAVGKKDNLQVGLLNIGSEELKGTERAQNTYAALQKLQENGEASFVGNVEGRAVFESGIDVLVTDGFTGNIFLKTVEGVSEYLFDQLHSLVQDKNALSSIEQFAKKTRYDAYAGALVAGVEGLVIKCHGRSTAAAMSNAIQGAAELHSQAIIPQMKKYLS
jgi:glycerol-3-phosphate acyltransferase PlsX